LLTGLSTDWISCNEGEDTLNTFDVVGHLIEGEKNIPRIEIIMTKGETKAIPPFNRIDQMQQNAGKTY